MRKKISYLMLLISVLACFSATWMQTIIDQSQMQRLDEATVETLGYREHNIGEDMIGVLKNTSSPGKYVGIYLLETKYGYQKCNLEWTSKTVRKLEEKWEKQKEWKDYIETTEAIWNDVKYFPVPEFTGDKGMTVSYVNTWMSERTYGGQRGHEGTDIMASKNERGLYPIISMTDGIVTKKGWLEKGGYRIGIESPGGVYFYYAHLHEYADIEVGDTVKAGDILGFMGDSGYGPEGTVGQFAVHLHLGIYIYPDGKEVSINPYWILRYIENRKVKCYTEI